jgi:hypothetical protein
MRIFRFNVIQAFNTFIGQVSPIALQNVNWKFYILFICLNFFDFIAVLFFFPETKGTSSCCFVAKLCLIRLFRKNTGGDERSLWR